MIHGWHINMWRDAAFDMVKAGRGHLKVLSTAIDKEKVREWRALNPTGLLVVRQWFPDGTNEYDWSWRTDRLLETIDPLLEFGPIAETPWNEQLQELHLLGAHSDMVCESIFRLNQRGVSKTAAGNFSVTWPRLDAVPYFYEAINHATYFSTHTYSAPNLWDNWESNIGHAVNLANQVRNGTGKHTLITEFGIDRGVLGERLSGWRTTGQISATQYNDQLRWAVHQLPSCVDAVFRFCNGCGDDWATFRDDWEVVKLHNENWEAPLDFVLGFKTFADALRKAGIDPGAPTKPEDPALGQHYGEIVTTQPTSTGFFTWIKTLNDMFFVSNARAVIAYNGGNLKVAR